IRFGVGQLIGCLCQCKDTNLKAIHNSVAHGAAATELFMPMQRYKFESNSQLFLERFNIF
ncbi:MAG: hypothetical protein J6N71_07615, partial [Muribaculaceae bacterium]|nr:hypothetical protein [Muribaculaceae bacterium]